MPELVREIAEWRAAGLGAHVDLCWRRGVLLGEPGWFYAREGTVSLGTPFERDSPVMANAARATFKVQGYLLQLGPVEDSNAG